MVNSIALIALLAAAFVTCLTTENKFDTLKLVHVVFRHGDRTPTISQRFPTDPQINDTYFPFGKNGELTLDGKKHSYILGKQIRKRYDEYLGSQFYTGVINSTSSDTPRTQMTLQSVHAGLFPPKLIEEIATSLAWQPISYKTIPWQQDELLMVYKKCPQLFEFENSNLDPETTELYDYVSNHTGTNRTTFNSLNMFDAYDTLLIKNQLGYDMPEWAKVIYPEPLRTASLQLWHDVNTYKLPLAVGPLIEHISIINKQKIAIRESEWAETKMFLFSCHDSNISALLGAIGYKITEVIKYNAAIFIELHLINKQYGIKMFYRNGNNATLTQLKIKNCGKFCPLEKFTELTKPLYDPWPVCF